MPDLNDLFKDYAALEKNVQQMIEGICAPFCSSCMECCCRPDICDESIDSLFLQQLCDRYPPAELYSDTYGWLTHNGCALQVGRPPVCYQFICNVILQAQPDLNAQRILRVLSGLMEYVGMHANGELHLTEITTPEDFEHMDIKRIDRQLKEAKQAYRCIESFFESGRISSQGASVLQKIYNAQSESQEQE